MTNDDTFLSSQFAAYRNELMADVTPAGPGAVRTTVRHRRRIAITAGTALAIALIAGPAAGYAALSRGPAPPAPGTSQEPTISASPTPSTTTPSPSPSVTTQAAPDGHIARRELLNARVTLPDWWGDAPCNVNARLNAQAPGEEGNWLDGLDYADVDRDGAEETIAMVGCKFNDKVIQKQVVVFDRNAAGAIVTMGQVLTSRPIGWIFQVDAQADGSIRIEVGDREPAEQVAVVKQWRTYGWTGTTFQQTGGPTEFPPSTKADLQVTATVVTFQERPDDWWRHGTTTVTLKNNGPADAAYVYLSFDFNGGKMRHEGDAWKECVEVSNTTSVPGTELFCLLGPLKAGASRTIVFGLSNSLPQPDAGVMTLIVTPIDQNRDPLPDEIRSNNEVNRDYR